MKNGDFPISFLMFFVSLPGRVPSGMELLMGTYLMTILHGYVMYTLSKGTQKLSGYNCDNSPTWAVPPFRDSYP
jgi:hypothetical protein